MTHYRITHTIFAASVLLVSTGMAHAEVVQCKNAAGDITFTDVACKEGSVAVQMLGAGGSLAAGVQVLQPLTSFAAAERARTAAWSVKPASKRGMAADVAMLKVAKSTMISNDQASALLRQQTLIDAAQAKPSSYWSWLISMVMPSKTQIV